MTYVKKTIHSDQLAGILDLPEPLKHRKIKLFIFPANEDKDEEIKYIQAMRGAYKNKLSTSKEFSEKKEEEIELEVRKYGRES